MRERVAGLCGAGERVTRLVSIFLSRWERKIKVSPGPYPASNSPPDCCI